MQSSKIEKVAFKRKCGLAKHAAATFNANTQYNFKQRIKYVVSTAY